MKIYNTPCFLKASKLSQTASIKKCLGDNTVKRAFFSILMLLLFASNYQASAQEKATQPADTTYLTHSGTVGLNFSSTTLNNWQAGGVNTIAVNFLFNKNYKYEKGKHLWTALLEATYGVQRLGEAVTPFEKIDDLLHINFMYGYKIKPKWYVSYTFDLRTQWDVGRMTKDLEDGVGPRQVKISSFMSPGFINSGASITFKHNFGEKDFFIANFQPFSSFKITTITDQDVFNGFISSEVYGLSRGESVRFEYGLLSVGLAVQKTIKENTRVTSNLGLFSSIESPGNIDVAWDVLFTTQINNWLGVNMTYNLIYDDDIVSKIQSKFLVGVGVTFKL